jgi:hypothetical protein
MEKMKTWLIILGISMVVTAVLYALMDLDGGAVLLLIIGINMMVTAVVQFFQAYSNSIYGPSRWRQLWILLRGAFLMLLGGIILMGGLE